MLRADNTHSDAIGLLRPVGKAWASTERAIGGESGANHGTRTWLVDRIGYRVPREQFDGIVHGVFASACYIDCGGAPLLTVVSAGVADGPTMLVLGADVTADLRTVFNPGDRLRCRGGRVLGRSVVLELARARTWRVPKPRSLLSRHDMVARVALAQARLVEARRARVSVLNRSGDASIAGVEHAVRRLDAANALARLERFVGWGEGLTPAGDDYLVGLFAALGVLVHRDAARRTFLDRMRGFVASQYARTTPISAHWLALASHGHFNADLLRALDALRAEPDAHAARHAFDALTGVGATSGADALAGILSGFAAWMKPTTYYLCSEHNQRR
jgi:Protein of unknown function (DUF2877)